MKNYDKRKHLKLALLIACIILAVIVILCFALPRPIYLSFSKDEIVKIVVDNYDNKTPFKVVLDVNNKEDAEKIDELISIISNSRGVLRLGIGGDRGDRGVNVSFYSQESMDEGRNYERWLDVYEESAFMQYGSFLSDFCYIKVKDSSSLYEELYAFWQKYSNESVTSSSVC